MHALSITSLFLLFFTLPSFNLKASEVFNYSGKLRNESSVAFESGQYELGFRIWDSQSDGQLLWGRTLPVQVLDGSFNVLLGNDSGNPISGTRFNYIGDAFSLPETYIEISIVALPNGAAPSSTSAIFPRQRIASTAYSFRSESAESADNGVPPGLVSPFAGASPPEGWLLCNGQELNRIDYPELFATIGTAHGTSSETTFNLPDYRGLFLRGVDGPDGTNSDRDPDSATRIAIAPGGNTGNTLGSVQDDSFKAHRHFIASTQAPISGDDGDLVTQAGTLVWRRVNSNGGLGGFPDLAYEFGGNDEEATVGEASLSGSNETRPKNAYVNYIIKY
ncbi:tail fiber protein [Roseibacillus persicicus]|uniref:Phage tail collar domain-containing protein n=1 Tax=Roseibacillus persicicus TaxID=454148 RepID=A0A918TWN4_9BACT|nr:tail fiber protein [Roseibacillus persicicus]GHC65194.1 hypothetical protein GCM10007100_36150 [Roseibacillus persicicus]